MVKTSPWLNKVTYDTEYSTMSWLMESDYINQKFQCMLLELLTKPNSPEKTFCEMLTEDMIEYGGDEPLR